jgi:hypothetical protein
MNLIAVCAHSVIASGIFDVYFALAVRTGGVEI